MAKAEEGDAHTRRHSPRGSNLPSVTKKTALTAPKTPASRASRVNTQVRRKKAVIDKQQHDAAVCVSTQRGAHTHLLSQQRKQQHDAAVSFSGFEAFYSFLEDKHAEIEELWVRIYKKSSGVESIDWQSAVCAALCWGWIDSLMFSIPGADYYIQRFTPRRTKSIWSKRNVANVERLIQQGKMRPPGLEKVDAAKQSGRWQKAYNSKTLQS
jgi:hypothetical protein